MAIASASGVAMESSSGSKKRIARSEGQRTGGKHPQEHDAEEEPVNVGVEVADMERAGAQAEEPDEAGEAADNHAGEENLFEEIEHHREALLDFRDVVVVDGVERFLERAERAEEAGRFLLERIGRGRRVK